MNGGIILAFLLFIGMYVAKNEERIISCIKKRYATFFAISSVGTIVLTGVAIVVVMMLSYYHRLSWTGMLNCMSLCETLATTFFVSFILILTMKVRLNNKILDFLGIIALEVYLIHRFFLVVLNSQYITISNNILYLAAVYVCTIMTAIVLIRLME